MDKDIKRIAMVSTHGYFDPVPVLGRTDTGGQVVYVLELAKALSKKGIKVDIYTRWFEKDKAQIDPVPEYPNLNVVRIPAGEWKFLPKEYIYDVLPELSNNMIELIKKNGWEYDLFHGHYVDGGIVACDVAKSLGKPFYFTAHSLGAWKREQMGGDPDEMEEKFKFKHRISEEIRLFKSVNAQTVTTILQLEKINELYNFSSDNIKVINPGVNIHIYKPLGENDPPDEINLPKKYVYCISRMDTNKGHDFLLRAFNIVKDKVSDVDLVIGGGSKNPKPREQGVIDMINGIIDECNMRDRVHLLGYVPDEMMVPYYRNAQLFTLPSLFEPFGLTTQEAMACRTAVIASKYGGIRTIIENEANGILVDPSNTDEFASAILKVLQDNEVRNKLANSAYKTIINEYSWDAIAEKNLLFFKEYM